MNNFFDLIIVDECHRGSAADDSNWKKILEYYHSKDIIYGDVKDDNILINSVTGKISFCDMDNIYARATN